MEGKVYRGSGCWQLLTKLADDTVKNATDYAWHAVRPWPCCQQMTQQSDKCSITNMLHDPTQQQWTTYGVQNCLVVFLGQHLQSLQSLLCHVHALYRLQLNQHTQLAPILSVNCWCRLQFNGHFQPAVSKWWLDSWVVSVRDSGTEGPRFKSQLQCCPVTVLGKLFTPIVPLFTKQQNW